MCWANYLHCAEKPRVTFVDQATDENGVVKEKPVYVYDPSVSYHLLVPAQCNETLTPELQEITFDENDPPLIKPIAGFRTEYPSDQYNLDSIDLAEKEKHTSYFKNFFDGQRTFHTPEYLYFPFPHSPTCTI